MSPLKMYRNPKKQAGIRFQSNPWQTPSPAPKKLDGENILESEALSKPLWIQVAFARSRGQ